MTENIHKDGDADNELTEYGRRLLAHRKNNLDWTYSELKDEMNVSNNTVSKWGSKYENITEEEVEGAKTSSKQTNGNPDSSQDTNSSDTKPEKVDKLEMKVEDTRKEKNNSNGGKNVTNDGDDATDDNYRKLDADDPEQINFFAQKWSEGNPKRVKKGIKKLKQKGMSKVDIENNDVM